MGDGTEKTQTSLNPEGAEVPHVVAEAPKSTEMGVDEISKIKASTPRPVFKALVAAKVVQVKLMDAHQENKDKKGNKYARAYLQVHMELEKQLEDGTIDVVTNYSISLYPNQDGTKRIFWGFDTDASRLRDLVCETFGMVPDNVELSPVINKLVGSKVMIKSEERPKPGKSDKVMKAIIKQIRV